MLPLLLSLATPVAQAGDPAQERAFWEAFAAAGTDVPTQVAWRQEHPWTQRRAGGDLLDVYEYGDVVVLVDEDGDWFDEALAQLFLNPNSGLEWVLESMQEAFYTHYDDEYEYLTALTIRDLGLFFAFYSPLSNDVDGLGYRHFAGVEKFDNTPGSPLEGFIFMNSVGLWEQLPLAARMTFGQEFMHRWGSFVQVTHTGVGANELLGRDTAHWSYWLDTDNSPMEGNDWTDNGDGTYTVARTTTSTYSPLDLYLMGFEPSSFVPDMTLLQVEGDEQTRVDRNPASAPESFNDAIQGNGADVTVTATPVTISIDDIVAAEGARNPSAATSPKTFHMAFVVLVLEGDPMDEETMQAVDDLRASWETDWEADVGGRADLVTTLGDGTAPQLFGPVDTGDTGDDEKKGCGCDSAAAPGWWLALLGATTLLRRRHAAPLRRRQGPRA